jgi:hypothetical protein
MGIAPDFVLLGAIGATLMLDRAIVIRRPRWAVARKGIHLVGPPNLSRKAMRHRIKWVDAAEFGFLIRTDPDLVIFRLIDDPLLDEEQERASGVVAVTLEQLANTIPWIPSGSRVVIYRAEGIDPTLANDVAACLRGRELWFFAGNADSVAETQQRIG